MKEGSGDVIMESCVETQQREGGVVEEWRRGCDEVKREMRKKEVTGQECDS